MSIDLFNTQLVTQHFAPGKDFASIADRTGSISLRHSQSHEALESNDQAFLKTLERVSDNQQLAYNSNLPEQEERPVAEQRPLGSGSNKDTSDSLDHTDNYFGTNRHTQTENNAAAGGQNIDPANINRLDLIKQLGLDLLLTNGYGGIDNHTFGGENAKSGTALEHDAAVSNRLALIDPSRLQMLLMHFQANGNPHLSDQNSRLVQLINMVSGNENLNSTKDPAFQIDPENLKQALKDIHETQLDNEKTTVAGLLKKIGAQLSQTDIPRDTTEGDKTLVKRQDAGWALKDISGGKNVMDQNLAEVNRLSLNPGKEPSQEIAQNIQDKILKSDLQGHPAAKSQSTPFGSNPLPPVDHGKTEQTGKVTSLNPSPFSADKVAVQVLTAESDTKEGGLLLNHSQSDVKTPEAKLVAPETEMLQKDFRSQTVNQIVQKAVLHLNGGQQEVRLDLKPEFLGHIRMQIITESQQVTVRILTEYPMVKELIENNLQQLKSELQNHGLEIEELDVSVEDHADQNVADRKLAAQAKLKSLTENVAQNEDNPSNNAQANTAGSIRNESGNRIDFFA